MHAIFSVHSRRPQSCLFGVLMALLVGNPARANQSLTDASPEILLTSIAELRERRSIAPDVIWDFEIDAHLVFVDERDCRLYLQSGRLPLSVTVTADQTAELSKLHPGAHLRVLGHTVPNSHDTHAIHVDVVNPDGQLTSRRVSVHRGLASAQLKTFVNLTGRILHVYSFENSAHLSVAVGDKQIVDIFVSQVEDVSDLLMLVRRHVKLQGLLRQTLATGQLNLALMRSDQIRMIQKQPPPERNVQTLHAFVLATNGVNEVVVSDWLQPVPLLLETHHAWRLRPGDILSGAYSLYDNRKNRDSHLVGIGWHVKHMGHGLLSDLWPVRDVEDIRRLGRPMPRRIRVEAEVEASNLVGRQRQIQLVKDAVPITAMLVDEAAIPVVAPHDRVIVSGAPLLTRNSMDGSEQLELRVASGADITVMRQSYRVAKETIWVSVLCVMGAAVAGVAWNTTLQRKVAKRTESLKSLSTHLSTAFNAMRDGVLVTDADCKVTQANERFRSLFGFSPEVGNALSSCLDQLESHFDEPEVFRGFCQDVVVAPTPRGQVELKSGDRTIIVRVNAILSRQRGESPESTSLLGKLWQFEDITERRTLEQELLHSQKLEALGHLSSGIAHDFNNLLTVISANAMLVERLSGEHKLKLSTHVEMIESAVGQAADLTRQMLDFSRRSPLTLRVVDANELLRHTYELFRRSLDASVHLNLFLQRQPLPVEVDVTRLKQVLLNLCINARDAIDAHGAIRLRTRVRECEDSQWVAIEVEDDGCGIPEEIQSQIFDPFFTTKSASNGTGLGLSTAIGTVEQHGGNIELRSEPEAGTLIRILLPLAESNHVSTIQAQPKTPQEAKSLRLLLVDDEELVRISCQSTLQNLGHQVTAVSNGRDALELLHADGASAFDVVLLDLTMPVMTGHEAYERIRATWPELPIVICSGYSAAKLNLAKHDPSLAFVPKPYQMQRLQQTLLSLTARAELN